MAFNRPNKMMKFLPLLALLLLFSGALVPEALGEEERGIAGKEAPPLHADYWINLPEGEPGKIAGITPGIDMRRYRGKVVLMLFFQAWCEASDKRSFPKLKELVDHYAKEDGIQFFAVQTAFEGLTDNTPSKLQPTAEKFGLTSIPFGHCVKLRGIPNVNVDYNTGGTPWWVVVDKDGQVVFNGHFLEVDKAVANLNSLLAATPATTATP